MQPILIRSSETTQCTDDVVSDNVFRIIGSLQLVSILICMNLFLRLKL